MNIKAFVAIAACISTIGFVQVARPVEVLAIVQPSQQKIQIPLAFDPLIENSDEVKELLVIAQALSVPATSPDSATSARQAASASALAASAAQQAASASAMAASSPQRAVSASARAASGAE